MFVISLPQPWASLVALGEKKFDTKIWNTDHRGQIAIHALAEKTDSHRQTASNQPFANVLAKHGLTYDTLPFGAIVATADLASVHHAASMVHGISRQERKFSAPWHSHPFMFEYVNVKKLNTPVPAPTGDLVYQWEPAALPADLHISDKYDTIVNNAAVEDAPVVLGPEEAPTRKSRKNNDIPE